MEAKQIHREFYRRFHLASWLDKDDQPVDKGNISNQANQHYAYLGVGDEFQGANFLDLVTDFFGRGPVYVATTPGKSCLVELPQLVETILPYLGKKEVGVMTQSMDKIIFFASIGSFQKGIYRDYPKSRLRPVGHRLELLIGPSYISQDLMRIADALRPLWPQLPQALHQDYGGNMEELWIDLALVEGRGDFSFRFQKRVSSQGLSGGHVVGYDYNVGHYSVVPDFRILESLETEEEIRQYILSLMEQSLEVLVKKAKSLGGFDAQRFRNDFRRTCQELGVPL